jgi:O-methyltransferase involved in polyketide biosynthesis
MERIKSINIPPEMKKPNLAPQLEARYKLISKVLKKCGVDQILELASGLTPRGLNQTLKNESIKYVEIDLPEVVKMKKAIFSKIIPAIPSNLHLLTGDVLNQNDLDKAVVLLDINKPVAIINEGLMRYLSFPEKERLARNIKILLNKFGGVWITSDISLKKILEEEDRATQDNTKHLSTFSQQNLDQNLFESVDHAKDFFSALGFSVEQHSFLEVTDELASPQRLKISSNDVRAINSTPVVFVMRIK